MGELEDISASESQVPNQKKKSLLFSIIMLIIGLFSPVLISVFNYAMIPEVLIQGMFWTYYQSSNGWYENGFSIISPYAWMSVFPFLLLRMVPVFQMYRYYDGKTTRKRVLIASIIGDGYFLFTALLILYFTIGYSDTYHIPLPFQILFSLIVLLVFHIPEPTTPWKSEEKPKSWWKKIPTSKQKKSDDDDTQLW